MYISRFVFRSMLFIGLIISGCFIQQTNVSADLGSTEYYVSKTGSDNNPGTLTSPWKTLSYAVSRLRPGDVLFIRGGIYQEHFWISNSGTQSNPIVITHYLNEEVIIDGMNNSLPQKNSGTPLIGITADWVVLSNVTIRFSGGLGITSNGTHVTLDNLYVHHSWGSGVILSGNYDLIRNSRIWYNSTMNENGQSPSAWGSGVSCARYPDYCTIRRTTVWGNWGEGISTFEALHTTIEDNVSYDNQINIYVSDTKYTTIQRNLIYCTPANPIENYSNQFGIALWDEKGVPIPLGSNGTRYPSSDNIIVNNLATGCDRNLIMAPDAINNNLYAYNTLVDAEGNDPVNVFIYAGTTKSTNFINNLILQEDNNDIGIWNGTGITFSHNLWSKNPPSTMIGNEDVIGNPKITKNGLISPGELTANYFKLLPDSPAIDKAISIDGIFIDYFFDFRGTLPDIGGDEQNPIIPSHLFLPIIH